MGHGITANELHELLYSDNTFALIDVRGQREYQTGHIFGASRLENNIIADNLPVLVPYRDIPIILYSTVSDRAGRAAEILSAKGFSDIRVLDGGISSWINAGYDTVEGIHVQSKAFGEIVGDIWHELTQISPAKLKEWLCSDVDNVRILEVRPVWEVKKTGSIQGAVSVPGYELFPVIEDYVREGRRIVLTCAGRTRSIIAAASLKRLGYIDNIYELENGTRGWILEGGKLEEAVPASSPTEESKAEAVKRTAQLAAEEQLRFISPYELQEMRAAGRPVTVLDTRQKALFAQSEHIDGSLSYEGGQIVQNTDDALIIHNADYVLADCSDTVPIMTAYWLKRMGIPNISILKGGISAWKEAGYSVTKESPVLLPDKSAFSEEDLITDPIAEAKHYIEWESKLSSQDSYMEYFRRKGVI